MKQKQVREVAYLGKKVYFGNKPYTLHRIDLKNNEFALVTDELLDKINEKVLRILDLYTEKSSILLKGIINERGKEE